MTILPDTSAIESPRKRVPSGRLQQTSAGFSLVELMIAMVLGLSVIGGAVAAFSGSSRSAELNQSISQLQANARFALDTISTDIRMAGFLGCASAETAKLNISTGASPMTNFAKSALSTAVVGSPDWQSNLPDGYTPPSGAGAPVPGTHLLQTQYAASPGYQLASNMFDNSSAIAVDGNAAELVAGELAVISNCDTGDLFEIASVNGTGAQRTVNPAESLTQPYLRDTAALNTTRVLPFVSSLYYIGDTARVNEHKDPIRSLYLQTFPYDPDNNPPLELIEGVDQLQLAVGIWQPDNTVRFVNPDVAGLNARTINMIRVGLLMTSIARHPGSVNNRPHTVAGRTLLPQGGAGPADGYYPNDKRIRVPFSSTVKVRNRFPGNRT